MDEHLLQFNKCDVFTPSKIAQLMSEKLKKGGKLLEPAVGTGDLLKFINSHDYDEIDVYDIKEKYLATIEKENVNKHLADFVQTEIDKSYDNIILNPPYIRIQDLSPEYREYIKTNFSQLEHGLVDLYYVFLIKCLSLLKEDGIMVAITPNSYLYNKSALALRKYLLTNKYIEEIIDYQSEKVFDKISVYCCITIFTKKNKNSLIYNNKVINYEDLDNKDYSLFSHKEEGKTLRDICKIRNGIATLRDKIFIHPTPLFEEPCWQKVSNSKEIKYIIHPYQEGVIIAEEKFKEHNPQTYQYLFAHKDELAQRDKGNKKYPIWYAYGRSQSLLKSKAKQIILLPTFMDPENIILVKSDPILFYGCLCIEAYEQKDLSLIEKSIINNFDQIVEKSSKRGGGWINVSSRILYDLPP